MDIGCNDPPTDVLPPSTSTTTGAVDDGRPGEAGAALGLYGDPFGESLLAGELPVTPDKNLTDVGLRRDSACSSQPPKLGGIDSLANAENVKQDDKICLDPSRRPMASMGIPAA
jgi:hypothetical protein